MKRFLKCPLWFALLSLVLAQVALATEPLYQNFAQLNYTIPGNPPPNIDATAFDNQGTFAVSFSTFLQFPEQYETANTLFYTNNGTMVANSPISTNGFVFDLGSVGCGFIFDDLSTNFSDSHLMAGTFYNAGTILCDSTNTGNNTLDFFESFLGNEDIVLLQTSVGLFTVSATNIITPGTVDVGVGGLMQFTGQNADFTRSSLKLEGNTAGQNLNSIGTVGNDTNQDWDPSIDLGLNFAESSFSGFGANGVENILILTNSTPYFSVVQNGPSNQVVRAVFLMDTSASVATNVYIDPGLNTGVLAAPGAAHVEWIGTYQNVATGQTISNFLYLTDDYVLGASTNVAVVGGLPDNFTFLSSSTRIPLGNPLPPSFPIAFQPGAITNPYAYLNAQLIATTVATNASLSNPNGALTNLPGRIQITANNDLKLTLAEITGPNYMSLTATNQFDGSAGAQIDVPYSDVNLGVTNGFMAVSNLLAAGIPSWSGSVQAWSTRWIGVDANGITNDYRVLLVNSHLSPTTPPQVQNLTLHATNSLVISDVLNVFGSLYIDSQNLTLSSNGPAIGATSLQGELNWGNPSILGTAQLPNLLNVTNYGAMRFQNLAQFVANSNVLAVTPAVTAVAASGTLSEVTGRTNVQAGDLVVIGSTGYSFVTKITNTVPNQVAIAPKFDGSLSNLIAAINGTNGAGTKYSSSTVSNAQVTAGSLTNHAFTVVALTTGSDGDSVQTANSTATTNLVWSNPYLSGGVDGVVGTTNVTSTVSSSYHSFINNGLLSDQGSTIWADNFASSGTVSNGVGSFFLQSLNTTLTNGFLVAGGDVSIATGTLLTGGLALSAGKSLSLAVSNQLADSGATNGNLWSLGAGNTGAGVAPGLSLPVKPAMGDLLFTTITNIATSGTQVNNLWAGLDLGAVNAGFSNNAAIGQLMVDALGNVPPVGRTGYYFSGTGTSNAMYVDNLVLLDQATNFDTTGSVAAFSFNTNFVLYYAEALDNGISVAEKLNHSSNDHLRWVPSYVGIFSSTNLVYPDGVTNVVNAALAQSTDIDSDGNGIANAFDPTPFLEPSQLNFTLTLTNRPPEAVQLQWLTVANGTNTVYYTTNLVAPNWRMLTNFASPQPYPSPAANVSMFDVLTNTPRYYKVVVQPWLMYPY